MSIWAKDPILQLLNSGWLVSAYHPHSLYLRSSSHWLNYCCFSNDVFNTESSLLCDRIPEVSALGREHVLSYRKLNLKIYTSLYIVHRLIWIEMNCSKYRYAFYFALPKTHPYLLLFIFFLLSCLWSAPQREAASATRNRSGCSFAYSTTLFSYNLSFRSTLAWGWLSKGDYLFSPSPLLIIYHLHQLNSHLAPSLQPII